jgi:hypothetical protein
VLVARSADAENVCIRWNGSWQVHRKLHLLDARNVGGDVSGEAG